MAFRPREADMLMSELFPILGRKYLELNKKSPAPTKDDTLNDALKAFYRSVHNGLHGVNELDDKKRLADYAKAVNSIIKKDPVLKKEPVLSASPLDDKQPFTGDQMSLLIKKAMRKQASRGGGGSEALHAGGAQDTVSKSTTYVPTVPLVSAVKNVSTPCAYERKVVNGKDAYWSWNCQRATNASGLLDGVKKCTLHRVQDKRTELVPVNCLQEYVNVLKGFEVDRVITTDSETNESVVRQTVTPQVDVYGTMKREAAVGKGVAYKRLTRVDSKGLEVPDPMDATDASFKKSDELLSRALGGSSKKKGGASGPELPNVAALRRKEFQLNDQDITEMQLALPSNMMEQPNSWKSLPPLDEDDKIAFYSYDDSYGVVRNNARQNGFPFSFRYLPYTYMTEKSYLEWLVTLQYKMRSEFPDYMLSTYDPVLDTIATVETSIMVALGRLESVGQFFDRKELFEGADEHKGVMHKYLLRYAMTPPTDTWYSPLSMRYTAVPTDVTKAYPDESEMLNNLKALYRSINTKANNGDGLKLQGDGVRLGLNYRQIENLSESDAWKDADVVAVVEDELLSMLARLQFVIGYAVNLKASAILSATLTTPIVDALLKREQRRFLSKELIQYLETFSLEPEDTAEMFIRLSNLRKLEAEAQGVALPGGDVSSYVPNWNAADGAQYPQAMKAIATPGKPSVAGAFKSMQF